MEIIDFLGRKNTVPDTDFEKGRQEVIARLVKTYENRMYHIKQAIALSTTMSNERKEELLKEYNCYHDLIGTLILERSKNADIKYYGATSEIKSRETPG